MNDVVLDASAVLAFVLRESGHQLVAPHMTGGLISAVNYSEVLKKSVEHGGSAELTAALLERSQLRVIEFDLLQAKETAKIWPAVKSCGLSFADRTCLILGLLRDVPVFTADRRMSMTDLPVTVKLFRNSN